MYDLKRHQEILKKILFEFANFCDSNNLKYYLDSGTLLGAVRHKDFIPWDNDIDVNMPREDYEIFLKLVKMKSGISNNINIEYPGESIYCYARVVYLDSIIFEYPNKNPIKTHIYIDVFPKDFILGDDIKTKLVCFKSHFFSLKNWFLKRTRYEWKTSKNIFKKSQKILP